MKKVSLELSKQLKEAGYPQEKEYCEWVWEIGLDGTPILTRNYIASEGDKKRLFASPNADEILEMLQGQINENELEIYKLDDGWHITYSTPEMRRRREVSINLADAAAKCWLYLKQNSLLPDSKEKV